MKVLIVDTNENYALAMKNNGDYIKIKNKDYEIGSVVEPENLLISVDFKYILSRKMVSIAASMAIMIFVGMGSYGYFMPYSHINMDINPSVVIDVNYFDRILSVEGLNDDGDKVTSQLKITNSSLEDGISDVVDRAYQLGYFKNDNDILLSVSSDNDKKLEKIELKAEKKLKESLEKNKIDSNVYSRRSNIVEYNNAKKKKLSPALMKLIDDKKASEPAFDIDGVMKLPYGQIKKLLLKDDDKYLKKIIENKMEILKLQNKENAKKEGNLDSNVENNNVGDKKDIGTKNPIPSKKPLTKTKENKPKSIKTKRNQAQESAKPREKVLQNSSSVSASAVSAN